MESKENSNSSWLDRWRGLGWKYQALAISLILVVIIISITAGVLSSGGNQGMYTGILQGHYFFCSQTCQLSWTSPAIDDETRASKSVVRPWYSIPNVTVPELLSLWPLTTLTHLQECVSMVMPWWAIISSEINVIVHPVSGTFWTWIVFLHHVGRLWRFPS